MSAADSMYHCVFYYFVLQGLFSATLTQEVNGLVRAGLRNPVTVSISSDQKEVGFVKLLLHGRMNQQCSLCSL